MSIYKCRGKDCKFATDDLDAYIDHKVEEGLRGGEASTLLTEREAPKVGHRKVEDYLGCPECRPKFDEAYKKLGWTPPAQKTEGKKEEAEIV